MGYLPSIAKVIYPTSHNYYLKLDFFKGQSQVICYVWLGSHSHPFFEILKSEIKDVGREEDSCIINNRAGSAFCLAQTFLGPINIPRPESGSRSRAFDTLTVLVMYMNAVPDPFTLRT